MTTAIKEREMKQFPFGKGVPTTIDVNILREKIGLPEIGQLIPYAKIEELIDVTRDNARFKSITDAWRRKLYRENNLWLEAIPNKGFSCIDPKGRIERGAKFHRSGIKRIYRSAILAQRTETTTLDPGQLRTRDFLVTTGASLQLAAATAAKALK